MPENSLERFSVRGNVISVYDWNDDASVGNFGGVTSIAADDAQDFGPNFFSEIKRVNKYLALFAFMGGFSAATAMVIVESLALSTMVMNSIAIDYLKEWN